MTGQQRIAEFLLTCVWHAGGEPVGITNVCWFHDVDLCKIEALWAPICITNSFRYSAQDAVNDAEFSKV